LELHLFMASSFLAREMGFLAFRSSTKIPRSFDNCQGSARRFSSRDES
jgi:hypothetical protein